MEAGEIKKIYARYSRVYDLIFKRWFYPRQQHVIQALDIQSGQHVLDVFRAGRLADHLYLAVHGQRRRHHHAEGGDLHNVGHLFLTVSLHQRSLLFGVALHYRLDTVEEVHHARRSKAVVDL